MTTIDDRSDYRLEDRLVAEDGTVYLSGLQALVRVLLDHQRGEKRRGRNTAAFVSGYPGSPLAGFDKELERNRKLLDAHGIVHRPGVNEELAATSVVGSQFTSGIDTARFDGVAGMWYAKAPGVDRAGDALKHANYVGAASGGGVLAVAGDDPAAKSSSLPSGSEVAFYDALMPVLFPGNVHEVLELGLHGLMLSRSSGLWSGFKLVANVADATGDVRVASDAFEPVFPSRAGAFPVPKPRGYLLPPASLETERAIHTVRLPLALEYMRLNRLNVIRRGGPDDWLGIVAAGRTYYDLMQAFDDIGISDDVGRFGIRLLKISAMYPFDDELVREFSTGLEEVVVIEEKRPFLEGFVKQALYGRPGAPRVVGKTDEHGAAVVPAYGGLDADAIAKAVIPRIAQKVTDGRLEGRLRQVDVVQGRRLPVFPTRAPYYCSGCPHNRSSQVPEGTLVGAGIGCHGMVLWMDPDQVGDVIGITQMGGEGAQWVGMAPFVDTPHLVQNLGDGTFFHSGHLAVRAAVAAGVNITFKLLYNDAVAMTGGQDATGGHDVPTLTRLLEAEGARRIIITTEDVRRYKGVRLPQLATVRHRDDLIDAQHELATVPGVTVLIHDQQCANEKRRLRKRGRLTQPTRRIVINDRVCEGCGDCGRKSNCLSLHPEETEFGVKTTIHQSSCNIDESCLLGDCPSFITVETKPRRFRLGPKGGHAPSAGPPGTELQEPIRKVPQDDTSIRIVGIGGTGIVTISQVLGTAALLEGKHVSGLDQTGLAQKGGPVVSDVRLADAPLASGTKLSAQGADALIAFDALAATRPADLGVASPDRTIAVVSTERVPTGEMVADNRVAFPSFDELRATIDATTRSTENHYLDTAGAATRLFHNHMLANVIGLGAAYQAGVLPLAAESIERALELNGVAVQDNIAAFRWGRVLVAEGPSALPGEPSQEAGRVDPRARRLIDDAGVTGELLRLLEVRVPDLVAYQDARYAQRYTAFVTKVLAAERRVVPASTELAETVARHLYKLMAYKDEYEVARLHLLDAVEAQLSTEFGHVSKVTYLLHPPVLRALGLKRKVRFGPWARPALRGLAAMKRLRGTPLDPFGRTAMRRLERDLVEEYVAAIDAALEELKPETLDRVVELAALPDMVRGYEDVKLESVAPYRERLQALGRSLA